MTDVRCKGCGKLLGRKFEGHIEIVCPRCKRMNTFKVYFDKPAIMAVGA